MNHSIKKVAIAALGLEGKSALKYWEAQGFEVSIYDDELSESYIKGTIEEISNVDLISRSPPIRPDRLPVDIEHTSVTIEFFKHCPAPIIGVTGTKGKGTTCTLIAKFLEADGKKVHLVGNIGKPALDVLSEIKPQDVVVYELSSFQLWDLQQSPHIAVVLMVEPDHLDIHKDIEEYIAAKANIAKFQAADDFLYYHPTNGMNAKVVAEGPETKQPYMSQDNAYVENGKVMLRGHIICEVSDVKLLGRHNLENVCAAIASASHYVEDKGVYKKVLTTFSGLEHRLELVAEVNGAKYIDDSISTIPSTTQAALKAFDDLVVLIVGGSDKGSDYSGLVDQIIKGDLREVITMGKTGMEIEQGLQSGGYSKLTRANSIQEAVARAHEIAHEGDIVLLSPASASFDMFDNYKDRGEQFKKAVLSL